MSEKTLNLGIVAHADAGKTTLTEQILYFSGSIRKMGSVDEGTASTDTLPIERSRGISVKSGSVSVSWNDVTLNFIDAPGHSDFLSEVERSLSVLDAAVLVVSCVEGVQPQARMLIEAVVKMQLPCFLFLNKCDRAGSRSREVLKELQDLFGIPCLLFSEVESEGSDSLSEQPVELLGERLEDAVMACGEERLLEQYLNSPEKAKQELSTALSRAVGKAKLVPTVCGSSKLGIGVSPLLQAISSFLPQRVSKEKELCARVYQVEHDPAMGRGAYVRLFAGTLSSRDAVLMPDGTEEKVTVIRKIAGRRQEDAPRVETNEIALVYGLSTVRAGDLLGKPCSGLREYRLCEPLMISKVETDQEGLEKALGELCAEDPSLAFQWNREKREAWVHLTGRIQAEVLQSVLKERWGIEASLSKPSVIYRETPQKSAEGFEAYLAPKPCWAVVRLLLEPLPRGSGVEYESGVSPGRLAYRYQTHIKRAFFDALKEGLSGWEITDLKATLIDGESHHVHTHPLDFFVATPMAVMNGMQQAGSKLLEPILRLEITAPKEYLGKVISLVTGHRGRFETPLMREKEFELEALVPAAESFDFPVELAAASAGNGMCSSRFSHYEDCPPGMGCARERITPDPLDRARFILWARSALSDGESA